MSVVPVELHESCTSSVVASAKIDGRSRPRADRIVRRKFAKVAKILWDKPDVAIALAGDCDPRTGRRILRGELDVPLAVMLAAVAEMLRPLD